MVVGIEIFLLISIYKFNFAFPIVSEFVNLSMQMSVLIELINSDTIPYMLVSASACAYRSSGKNTPGTSIWSTVDLS